MKKGIVYPVTGHLGFHGEKDVNIVAPVGVSKERFIKAAQEIESSYTPANWIRQRIMKGANDQALVHVNENPGKIIAYDLKTNKVIKTINI